MNSRQRCVRNLNVRSRLCSLKPLVSHFSSGFVHQVDGVLTRVSDDAVIAVALSILSERVARVSVLANRRSLREYLLWTSVDVAGRGDGGQGRNRTNDTRIFSPLLYQLSYLAIV
jgi:hypothetical protein